MSILLMLFFANNATASMAQENPFIIIGNSVTKRGSGYWQSSAIREWLNSSEDKVSYTNNVPSKENADYPYDKESGFLTNFTEEEQQAIAVTKRRVFTGNKENQLSDGGNKSPKSTYGSHATNNSMGDLMTDWKNYYYQIVLDKVFYLNTAEYFYYLESRDFKAAKQLRDDAKKKYNFTANYINWQLTHGVAGDARMDGT